MTTLELLVGAKTLLKSVTSEKCANILQLTRQAGRQQRRGFTPEFSLASVELEISHLRVLVATAFLDGLEV